MNRRKNFIVWKVPEAISEKLIPRHAANVVIADIRPKGTYLLQLADSSWFTKIAKIFWQKTRLSKHLSFNFKDIY